MANNKFILFLITILAVCLHGENAYSQKLIVSENARFLMYEDGSPFFYLGDTAWELFHRLNEDDIEVYLEDRKQKGFTVIQAVILAELDGLDTPNRNGDTPFIDNNPIYPNETYFAWVDKVLKKAGEKGLFVGLLPTWGDKVDKQWGVGPVIFNEENIAAYGKFLGERYKDYPNIIWINGGDRKGGDANYNIWNALGNAIKSVDENHLMTYHPSGESSSSMWFHHCDWLDFNTCQTGHAQTDYAIYRRLLIPDYNISPTKPCLDGEPRYEDIPIRFKVENGRFDATDIRQTLYWSLFSGACGYTYGCNDIWQFYTTDEAPVMDARNGWKDALRLPGSSQLVYARDLLLDYDYFSRVPDQSLILQEQNDDTDFAVATRGEGYAFVYLPNGNKITVSLEKISGAERLLLKWMNPRTGEIQVIRETEAKGTLTLQPESSGRGNDWVLIMEKN